MYPRLRLWLDTGIEFSPDSRFQPFWRLLIVRMKSGGDAHFKIRMQNFNGGNLPLKNVIYRVFFFLTSYLLFCLFFSVLYPALRSHFFWTIKFSLKMGILDSEKYNNANLIFETGISISLMNIVLFWIASKSPPVPPKMAGTRFFY